VYLLLIILPQYSAQSRIVKNEVIKDIAASILFSLGLLMGRVGEGIETSCHVVRTLKQPVKKSVWYGTIAS
jgi:hypothetical protein